MLKYTTTFVSVSNGPGDLAAPANGAILLETHLRGDDLICVWAAKFKGKAAKAEAAPSEEAAKKGKKNKKNKNKA